MNFQISDKVICIDDSPCQCGACGGGPVPVVKGLLYTIEDIDKDDYLILVGLDKKETEYHCAGGFIGAFRFRKLEDIKKENALKNYDHSKR